MNLSMHELDAELVEIEARIAAERIALEIAINDCTASLRNAVASPKTLLALTGVGFAVGKLMFGRPSAASTPVAKKVGLLGMLTGVAGTAFGLMQPRFGVAGIARWAASKYFGRDKKPKAAKPVRPGASTRITVPAERPRSNL